MKGVSIINHPDFGEVRNLLIKGAPWFVAKDLCDALGHTNSRQALNDNVDPADRADVSITDGSQKRQMSIVNESGMYSLIMRSRLEKARAFQRWVTSDVLPSIRKFGYYIDPSTVLSKKEQAKVGRLMLDFVNKHLESDDILKCSRKMGINTCDIGRILRGSWRNNGVMADLQDRAMRNKEHRNDAYSVERMNEVIEKLQ